MALGPMEREISKKTSKGSAEKFVCRPYCAANNTKILASIGNALHQSACTSRQIGNGHARHLFRTRHQTSLSVAQIDIAQNQRLTTNEGFDSLEPRRRTNDSNHPSMSYPPRSIARNGNDFARLPVKPTSRLKKQAAFFALSAKALNLRADSKRGSAVIFLPLPKINS